jgi:hypothetical protein
MYLVKTFHGYCLKIEIGHVEISVAFDDEDGRICNKSDIRAFDKIVDEEFIGGPFRNGAIDGTPENLIKALAFAITVDEMEKKKNLKEETA